MESPACCLGGLQREGKREGCMGRLVAEVIRIQVSCSTVTLCLTPEPLLGIFCSSSLSCLPGKDLDNQSSNTLFVCVFS